jgi:hypothetical protein
VADDPLKESDALLKGAHLLLAAKPPDAMFAVKLSAELRSA